ncbi:MAG: hypothetical protein LBB45_04665 [Methanobrevibacter sp.]|jgi:hypothetical protein|nr:hypothetical protein [Candidatus Methanovirga basalitermitum]
MKRRITRMINTIRKVDTILFISNRNEPENHFKTFLSGFKRLYDKHLIYTNIRHSEHSDFSFKQEVISNEMEFIEFCFNDSWEGSSDENSRDYNPFWWLGNENNWDKVMKHIKISNKHDFS